MSGSAACGNAATVAIRLDVTVYPDRWVPKDGSIQRFSGRVTGKLQQGVDGAIAISGSYQFHSESEKIEGPVRGTIVPRPRVTDQRLAARLSAAKIDGRDFPEMELELALVAGQLLWARFGMSWNRWPHRWTTMPTAELTWDSRRQRLTGAASVPARAVDVTAPPEADISLEIDGSYIGSVFAVRITAQPTGGGPRRVFNGGQRLEPGPVVPEITIPCSRGENEYAFSLSASQAEHCGKCVPPPHKTVPPSPPVELAAAEG